MATRTDIANLAIAAHSGEWVEDIDTAPGRTADAIRALWDASLDTALAAHPWGFARRTWRSVAALPSDQNPDPDNQFAYRLPVDCARVFELRPRVEFYEWDQRRLACGAGPTVTMLGTRRDVPVGEFSAFFVDYFAALLAWRICTPISASEAIRGRCKEDLAAAFAEAKADSGRAGSQTPKLPDSYVQSRVGGGPDRWR